MELGLALGHTGVGTISVSEVYYNKKHFNLEHLYKIAHILEVDICEFFKTTEWIDFNFSTSPNTHRILL